jgi:hypothetical protein
MKWKVDTNLVHVGFLEHAQQTKHFFLLFNKLSYDLMGGQRIHRLVPSDSL